MGGTAKGSKLGALDVNVVLLHAFLGVRLTSYLHLDESGLSQLLQIYLTSLTYADFLDYCVWLCFRPSDHHN